MRVVALFVGKPRSVTVAGTAFHTGGVKSAVEAVFLRFDCFDGDGQGNLRYHGGMDRTV